MPYSFRIEIRHCLRRDAKLEMGRTVVEAGGDEEDEEDEEEFASGGGKAFCAFVVEAKNELKNKNDTPTAPINVEFDAVLPDLPVESLYPSLDRSSLLYMDVTATFFSDLELEEHR